MLELVVNDLFIFFYLFICIILFIYLRFSMVFIVQCTVGLHLDQRRRNAYT